MRMRSSRDGSGNFHPSWLKWAPIGALLVGAVACSSAAPKVDVSARCYPSTDKSMDITRPEVFADITASTDALVGDPVTPVVRVDMLDASDRVIGSKDVHIGQFWSGPPSEVSIPIGLPRYGGVEAVASCSVSVLGIDGGWPRAAG